MNYKDNNNYKNDLYVIEMPWTH